MRHRATPLLLATLLLIASIPILVLSLPAPSIPPSFQLHCLCPICLVTPSTSSTFLELSWGEYC